MGSNFGKELVKDAIKTTTHEAAKVVGLCLGGAIVGLLATVFSSPDIGIPVGGMLVLAAPLIATVIFSLKAS